MPYKRINAKMDHDSGNSEEKNQREVLFSLSLSILRKKLCFEISSGNNASSLIWEIDESARLYAII